MYTKFPFRIHEFLRKGRQTKHGVTHAPDAVAIKLHKEYPRMPRIELPLPPLSADLSDVLRARKTLHHLTAGGSIDTTQLGSLLGHSLKAHEDGRRPYPSGGSLYPIETYLVGRVADMGPGVFHYHPTSHALEHLWDLEPGFRMQSIFPNEKMEDASHAVIFTSRWFRTTAKYGDFGYLLAVLEAGHLAQNLLLVGTALQVTISPVAAFDDSFVSEALDLTEEVEQPVYALALSA